MLRHAIPVRRDLDRIADEHGFDFHVIDNEIYWDESRAYRFTLRQIEEQIEKPTAELHQMCLEVVERAVKDEQLLQQLGDPAAILGCDCGKLASGGSFSLWPYGFCMVRCRRSA